MTDPIFALRFILLTIGLLAGGVLFAVGLFSLTAEGRDDLRRFYKKWQTRKSIKNKFAKGDFKYAMPILSSPEERTLLPYSAEDVKMVLALHKHLMKPHPTIYDEVAWDHGFYPHENDMETA